MYKFVIYSNNLELIKKFGNIVFNGFSNMHLVGIASTKNELSSLCKKHKINMIILSLSDSKNNSLSTLLSNIESKIIICNNTAGFKSSKYTLYLSYASDCDCIIGKLNSFLTKISASIIRKRVRKILEKLNFDFKLVGTNYLLESIVYSYLTKDRYFFDNLEKNVYPYVSKKYNVSAQNIKWSIIRSINNMKNHLNKSAFKDYYIDVPEKITPKFMIPELVNRL